MYVSTVGGSRYMLVIVDTFSRFTFVDFLGAKSEVTDILINFIVMASNRYDFTESIGSLLLLVFTIVDVV